MKSWSCGLQVVCLLCLLSLARTQLYEGSKCQLDDGGKGFCRKIDNCPGVREQIIRGVSPKICSFDRGQPIVCCPSVNPPSTKPTPFRPTPSRPSPTRPTPSWSSPYRPPSTRPVPTRPPSTRPPPTRPVPGTTVTRVDKTTKAGKKCQEYARYVYWESIEETLLPVPEVYNKSICGMTIEELIVGGVEANPMEFPHMAELGYGASEKVVDWKCGGSLISERFVLTAAHCLAAPRIGPVRWVRLGDLNLYSESDDADPVTFSVIERIKHEGYKPPAHYNDIALLKLDRDVTFTPYIRPACLNTIPGNPVGKLNVTASGWGKLEWTAEVISDSLMKVDLEIQDESRCNHTFRSLIRPNSKLKNGITPESMICAGDPQGKKDTCGGDSGGPLQIRLSKPDPFCMYNIIGLTSFGASACGLGDSPAVYTRVSNYIPWIERHVWP